MIYDSLENIDRYRGLSRGLDILIDWLGRNDIDDLEIGCNKIEGNRVFANVMETQTHAGEGRQFEAHRKYIDVHVDLEGEERFETILSGWGGVEAFKDSDEAVFDRETGRFETYEGTLKRGCFVLFMAGEPHMPNCSVDGRVPRPLKKICFKILDDRYWGEVDA